MNLIDLIPGQYRVLAAVAGIAVAGAAIWGAYTYWHHSVYKSGYKAAETIYIARETKFTAEAKDKLAIANEGIRLLQSDLTTTLSKLSKKESELHNEQITSAGLQSDLAAGRRRMSALVATSKNSAAGQSESTAAGKVDQGTSFVADLAPSAAIAIERLRDNENSAITRLDACIESYEAVEKALSTASIKE